MNHLKYDQYLLSSSPPGFELDFVPNDHYIRKDDFRKPSRFGNKATWKLSGVVVDDELFDHVDAPSSNKSSQPNSLSNTVNIQRISSWVEHYNEEDPEVQASVKPSASCVMVGMGKKKVSFADDLGKCLESILVMTESSDSPPLLRRNLCAQVLHEESPFSSENDLKLDAPRLMLNFSQPASDYVIFRNKIESNFVSLENVIIRDYVVCGTVKVKNISFEKSVTLRYTLDNWKTFTNVSTTYEPSGIRGDRFDTFSFKVECPSTLKVGTKLVFAIQYLVENSREFWDNNNGENYEIAYVSDKSSRVGSPERVVFTSGSVSDSSLSDFASWNGIDDSSPYW